MSKMCVSNYTQCFIGKIFFVLLHYKFRKLFLIEQRNREFNEFKEVREIREIREIREVREVKD